MFDRSANPPFQFSEIIDGHLDTLASEEDSDRPHRMIATVLSIETFKKCLRGKDVLLLTDSEAVEASLVKGYSSKQDLCFIIEIIWDLAASSS